MQPTLFLFHPGGFHGGTPSTEAKAAYYAYFKGFKVRAPKYPLKNLAQLWSYMRCLNAMIAEPAYAYGESAGGAIAARLVTMGGNFMAAGSFSPVPNVWDFFNVGPYASLRQAEVAYSTNHAMCDNISPDLQNSTRPIHVKGGTADTIIDIADLEAWAAGDADVTLEEFTGPHIAGGATYGSTLYESNMHDLIDFLAVEAGLDTPDAAMTKTLDAASTIDTSARLDQAKIDAKMIVSV
jgi:hypothetical protein